MSISPNRVSEEKRCEYLEAKFKEAYEIDAVISQVTIHDENWNWVKVINRFRQPGREFILDEHYKQGEDNSTDYVKYIKGEDVLEFKRYVDAELQMVEDMKIGNIH